VRQYKYFDGNMSKGKKFSNVWNKKNSLFAFWIGNNDVKSIQYKNVTKKIDEVTNDLFNIIYKLYNNGARNIIIFKTIPTYKDPYASEKKYKNNNLKSNILTFNNNLIEKSKLFFKKYSDINLIIYNTIDTFEEIISNCTKYKFKDCIHGWIMDKNKTDTNFNDYFWINTHISELANKYLVMDINYLLNSINK